MPHPRSYSTALALAAIPLFIWSLTQARWEQGVLILLITLAYAVLCLRTYTLTSGILMTAAAPLATTAMILLDPLDLFIVVVPGMLVIKGRNHRPWANTLINITAVGGGLAVGAWLYQNSLALFELGQAPLVYRLLPFLIALQARDLVNHGLIGPIIARQRGLSTWAVLWETVLQSNQGPQALNATGLGFAYLVSLEGPAVLLYLVPLLLGMHAAVAFYVRRAEMERAAEQDGLTRARNRNAFERAAQRTDWHGVVLVIDCDGLKRLNDTRGHLAGDELLKGLAHRLVQVAGEENVFRYGGDEFVVLLQDGGAIAAIERAVAETERHFGASASLGACAVPGEADDIAGAFPLADQRMYAAKEARRMGRVVGAGP